MGGGEGGGAGQGGVPHRFTVQAATHHTRAWKTLIYRKEGFILLLLHEFIRYASTMQKTSANPGGGGGGGRTGGASGMSVFKVPNLCKNST